jgi:hypothetical protein
LGRKNGTSAERKFGTFGVEWLNFEAFLVSLGGMWRYFFFSS